MQLILETKPTEDIQINMSMQAETPVCKNITNDIIKEINVADEENNPNISDGKIDTLEKSENNKTETEIDRLTSEPSETIEVTTSRDNNANGHKKIKSSLETDSFYESELSDNIKSTKAIGEITTNGIGCSQNENLSEKPNAEMTTSEKLLPIKTINSTDTTSESTTNGICFSQYYDEVGSENPNVEMESAENLLKIKNVNAEIHLKSNTNANSESSNKDDNLIKSNESSLKILDGKTTMNISHSVVPEDSSEIAEENATVDMQETGSFTGRKDIKDLNRQKPEKLSCVREISDLNKDIKNFASKKYRSSSENIIMPGDTLRKNEINTGDNVEMDLEINKQSNASESVLSKEAGKLNNETGLKTVILETIDDKKPNDVSTVEKIDKSSEVHIDHDVTKNDEQKTLGDKILEVNNVPSMDNENQDDVAMHNVEESCTGNNENSVMAYSEKLNSITVNKDVLPVIENCSTSEPCLSAQNEKVSPELTHTDHSLLSVTDDTHDVSMTEPIDTLINASTDASKLEQAVDDNVLEMKIDVELVDLDKEKSDENMSKSENSLIGVVSKETELVKITDPEQTSRNTINENEIECLINEGIKIIDVEINQVEDVPVETDDVEIVDLDKEKQDANIWKVGTVPNIIKKNEDKLGIIEPQLTPGKNIIKDTTEQQHTNEDLKNKGMTEITTVNTAEEPNKLSQEEQDKVEILDEDDIKIVENKKDETPSKSQEKEKSPETKTLPVVCKLSNTLDILSDDEEEPSKANTNKTDTRAEEKQCINIDDDDDIMLIDEDSNSKDAINDDKTEVSNDKEETSKPNDTTDVETAEKNIRIPDVTESTVAVNNSSPVNSSNMDLDSVPQAVDIISERQSENTETKKPLLPQNFLKTAKKNLADMTRHELEDFCILRIVESIVDRSNLSDIKTKMKTMTQNLEDFRKRAMMLTKQNRDLQVVLKSVQEEQKKRTNTPIQPLKITRSVGMQVLMNDKIDCRRKGPIPNQMSAVSSGRPARVVQAVKITKPPGTPPTIPVPRKVPVNNSPAKTVTTTSTNNMGNKTASPSPNGLRNPSPVQKAPEKRTHSRMQSTSSVTVDLTDDEPPSKINSKNTPVPPVRVVPPQNLLAQQRPFPQSLNSPRKVYIPISGPQGQPIRPGQTLMMRSGPPGPRQRLPSVPRQPQTPIRINKQGAQRHPAPLPDAMKQYTPPSWKALPPAPDLKLSKVENGIVISWKIDAQENDYETIASYQLYAYQETSAPPNTSLWKKIGDVKALPLPMACTLTQFMAGFKYYFAVRAVDIRSRLGPFSLPGSILLLNKL